MADAPKFNLSFQQVADPKSLSLYEKIVSGLSTVNQSIKSVKIDLPPFYRIFGEVNVKSIEQMPPVRVSNFPDLQGSFNSLAKSIEDMQVKTLKAVTAFEVNVPDKFEIDKEVKIKNFNDLLEGIEELKKGFNILIKKMTMDGDSSKPTEVSITNFPPTMVPTPVTHVSINGLIGFTKSNAVTVSTTLTPLPGTPLVNRRSLTVYNNSASNTFYIGGSDVTPSNGVPVPAGTFSPSFDASPGLVVYGITSSSTADARVLELSDEGSGK